MKIVVAPDSFKNSLRASDVARAIAAGWSSVRPQDEVIQIPMSDGGEGLEEALCAALNGAFVECMVCDPFMREHRGKIVISGDTAVIEAAEANGIELLARSELDPLRATSFGVGELIRVALSEFHCRHIIVGIGGSATVDGGAGMLQALGFRFYDCNEAVIPDGLGGGKLDAVRRVDKGQVLPEFAQAQIFVACDVNNILCGVKGSAAVFGPQKGATPEMVAVLDRNLQHFAAVFDDDGTTPGDGAAGGLGFALRKLGAQLMPGAQLVMAKNGFADLIADADMVITGEGCSDDQTVCGKLCSEIALAARKQGVPTVLVSGALKGDCVDLEQLFAGCFSISRGVCTLDEALGSTKKNLHKAGAALAAYAGIFSR